ADEYRIEAAAAMDQQGLHLASPVTAETFDRPGDIQVDVIPRFRQLVGRIDGELASGVHHLPKDPVRPWETRAEVAVGIAVVDDEDIRRLPACTPGTQGIGDVRIEVAGQPPGVLLPKPPLVPAGQIGRTVRRGGRELEVVDENARLVDYPVSLIPEPEAV